MSSSSSSSSGNSCRCTLCARKVAIALRIACKCGNVYCTAHRIDHDCAFNYFEENKAKLESTITKVVVSKVKGF